MTFREFAVLEIRRLRAHADALERAMIEFDRGGEPPPTYFIWGRRHGPSPIQEGDGR